MSGWKKRLNRTRPSAPAATSRLAMLGSELKNGPILTASGIDDRLPDGLHQLEVLVLDVAPRSVGVGGHEVDVQLQGIGAGLLDHAWRSGPSRRGGAVEAGDDRDRSAPAWRLATMPQVGVRARCCSRPSRGSTTERLGEALVAGVLVEAVDLHLVVLDLLLEQRGQDDGRGAGILQPAERVDLGRSAGRPRPPAGSSAPGRGSWVRRSTLIGLHLLHPVGGPFARCRPSARRTASARRRPPGPGRAAARPASGLVRASMAKRAFLHGEVLERRSSACGCRGGTGSCPRRPAAGCSGRAASSRELTASFWWLIAVAMSIAVGDAVAVGDDQRRPVVRLGLEERLERLEPLAPIATWAT